MDAVQPESSGSKPFRNIFTALQDALLWYLNIEIPEHSRSLGESNTWKPESIEELYLENPEPPDDSPPGTPEEDPPSVENQGRMLPDEEEPLPVLTSDQVIKDQNVTNEKDASDAVTNNKDTKDVNSFCDIVERINKEYITLRLKGDTFKLCSAGQESLKGTDLVPGDWVLIDRKGKEADVEVVECKEMLGRTWTNAFFTYLDLNNHIGVINNTILCDLSKLDFTPTLEAELTCSAIQHHSCLCSWRAISVERSLGKAGFLRPNYVSVYDLLDITLQPDSCHTFNVIIENSKWHPLSVREVAVKSSVGVSVKRDFLIPMVVEKCSKSELSFTASGQIPGIYFVEIYIRLEKLTFRKYVKFIVDNDSGLEPLVRTVIPSGCSQKSSYSGRYLKQYYVPKVFTHDLNVPENAHILMNIQERYPELQQGVSPKTYLNFFHNLLFLEQGQEEIAFEKVTFNSPLSLCRGQYFKFMIPECFQKLPISVGVKVFVTETWDRGLIFEGVVREHVTDEVYAQFSPELLRFHQDGLIYSIKLKPSEAVYKKMHHSVDTVFSEFGPRWLFPQNPKSVPDESCSFPIPFFNDSLNVWQKNAIHNALRSGPDCPYLIFGPPGTGKTITLVEIILQTITRFPKARILVAAPTNDGVDCICTRLLDYNVAKSSVVRLSGYIYLRSGQMPTCLESVSFLPVGAESLKLSADEPELKQITLSDILDHKIVCGTFTTLANLYMIGLSKNHFTHLVIDEAAQATEPSIMCAVALVNKNAKVTLVGDPLQLGPVVTSRHSKSFGLSTSFMERLMNLPLYKKQADSEISYDEKYVTQLRINYRSVHPIVDFISNMFYSGTLIAAPETPEAEKYTYILHTTIECVTGFRTVNNIFFHSVQGKSKRANELSTSLGNAVEVVVIAQYYQRLLHFGLTEVDIGIVTPYTQQVHNLHEFLDVMNLVPPKIGSVEEFQGQERKIMLFTAVSTHTPSPFLSDSKRLNVALSRSQYGTVIVGNSECLSKSDVWDKIIKHCQSSDSFFSTES